MRIGDRVAADLLKSVVQRFGVARVRAQGGSMMPAIRPGDLLVIESVDLPSVAADDVVVFEWEGRILAHRVVSTCADGRPTVQTRGDRYTHDDPPVDGAQIIGRVRDVIRSGRVASRAWRRPPRRLFRNVAHLLAAFSR